MRITLDAVLETELRRAKMNLRRPVRWLIQLLMRGDGCSDQCGSSGSEERWSDSGCILEVQPQEFSGSLEVGVAVRKE